MNDAHLHLIVNHLPIFSTLFGLLIIGWGLWKKNRAIQRIALVLFLLGAVSSFVAMETGEGAEEVVEEYTTGISHDAIHEHEEVAEIALWFAVITGVLSLLSIFGHRYNTRFQQTLNGVLIISATITLGMLLYTAYEGGKIRHPEAYQDATSQVMPSSEDESGE